MIVHSKLKTVARAAIALATLSALPAGAAVPHYDSLFIFGDSLSDPGNFYNLSKLLFPKPFPPPPFYFQGRASNGPSWVEYLADDLELNPTPVTMLPSNNSMPADGINFAFIGATTGSANFTPPPFPGIKTQVDTYVNLLNGQPADDRGLYILWGGANDYFGGFTSDPQESVNNLSAAIANLANAGARNIVAPNLPNLGETPLGRTQGSVVAEQLNLLTQAHNDLLAQSLDRLSRSFPQTNIISVDLNSLFARIASNPGSFGYKNITDNCTGINFPTLDSDNLPGWLACSSALANDSKAFSYYDNQHPTTATHRIIANTVRQRVAQTVPEPTALSAMALLGLCFLGGARKKYASHRRCD
jgi:phospholipase/lecithinase/hemolysin